MCTFLTTFSPSSLPFKKMQPICLSAPSLGRHYHLSRYPELVYVSARSQRAASIIAKRFEAATARHLWVRFTRRAREFMETPTGPPVYRGAGCDCTEMTARGTGRYQQVVHLGQNPHGEEIPSGQDLVPGTGSRQDSGSEKAPIRG